MNSQGTPGSEYDSSEREQTVPGFFKRVLESCRGIRFYALPLKEPGSRSVYYLCRLLLILGLFWGIFISYHYWSLTSRALQDIQSQLPPINFRNGVLDVEAPVPYSITFLRDYELLIDPEGERVRPRLPERVRAVLVNRALYVRNSPGDFWSLSTRIQQSDQDAQTYRITATTVQQWFGTIRIVLIGLWIILGIVEVMARGVLRTLLFSVGGFFANSQLKDSFSWQDILKISSYAVTPIFLIELLMVLVHFSLYFQEYMLIAAGTLWVYWIVLTLGRDEYTSPEMSRDGIDLRG